MGNETSSPGKAPKPFPRRCCAIEKRVWLSMDNIFTGIYYAWATRANCLTTSSHFILHNRLEWKLKVGAGYININIQLPLPAFLLPFFRIHQPSLQEVLREKVPKHHHKERNQPHTQTPISPWQPFQSCVFRGSPFHLAFDCSIQY